MMRDQNLNQSQLAEKFNISRVRVTQILNLLKLGPEIIKQVRLGGKQVTERQLRSLIKLKI
jgi:DNA-binding transcriptional regulator LsrR (DeoR family)